ncbi:hypothetical protein AGR4B_pAt20359 [Agrobacterium tumefaciens str. CFBP 5621]|nr:hypothetical protein AGR4B_pAt20359 [Agrobacterium tumefaciens str. CFBP 5621]
MPFPRKRGVEGRGGEGRGDLTCLIIKYRVSANPLQCEASLPGTKKLAVILPLSRGASRGPKRGSRR